MIDRHLESHAMDVVHKLIVHAKSLAHDANAAELASFLNDLEVLPECLADKRDRTDEFIEMLESIHSTQPRCQYVLQEFKDAMHAGGLGNPGTLQPSAAILGP